ncbi:6129_t:CDS:10 [Ambispora gerdemannii]|uniref:6129_t:CDS:1 n=1 Tax=Ambispora gerdemannii TaxID=144530 RepID=A0A9N8VG37_9GLOM|nr:6129_t:CDS:10 [Ambispora gerdemannii]
MSTPNPDTDTDTDPTAHTPATSVTPSSTLASTTSALSSTLSFLTSSVLPLTSSISPPISNSNTFQKQQQQQPATPTRARRSTIATHTAIHSEIAATRGSSSSIEESSKAKDVNKLTEEMFAKVANYLKAEMLATTEDFKLLEDMNHVTRDRYKEMSSMAQNLMVEMSKLQRIYIDFEPYVQQIDEICEQVDYLEKVTIELDDYSKELASILYTFNKKSRENKSSAFQIDDEINDLSKGIDKLSFVNATNERPYFFSDYYQYQYLANQANQIDPLSNYNQQKDFKENDSKKKTSSDEDARQYPALPSSNTSSSSSGKMVKVSSPMKLNYANALVYVNTSSSAQTFKKEHNSTLSHEVSSSLIESEYTQNSSSIESEYTRNIKKIIKELLVTNKYKIYGNWACCEEEWQQEYNKIELEKCVKKTTKDMRSFFTKRCENCSANKMISSFRLYILPRRIQNVRNEKPDVEIICHLIYEKYYRVFGKWECSHCRRWWRSAYTWISLEKFIDSALGIDLKANDDFYMEKCNRCSKMIKDEDIKCRITGYEPLVLSENGSQHKRDLCLKCKNNRPCRETGQYFGYRPKRRQQRDRYTDNYIFDC